MSKNKRPFLCRIGLHQWYIDGAMFTRADRCNNCDEWKHPVEGRRVELERDAWEQAVPGESMEEGMQRVTNYLLDNQ